MRKHNFSAGPAVLPVPVLEDCREALLELHGSGLGLLECSHRSKLFQGVIDSAIERFKRLLGVGESHHVLFLQGGASQQFFQVPMNLLGGGRASYLDTGTWSAKAIAEAKRYGTVDVPFSSKAQKYDRVPRPGTFTLPEGTRYLHYTSNNTVAGSAYDYIPDAGDAWLFCDASSNIFDDHWDGNRFDLLYGGAQKNLGPSGVTFVVIADRLLEHCDTDIPTLLRYGTQVSKGSMYNTPNTFGIFVIERTLAWIEELGGLDAVAIRNRVQAAKVYDVIDASDFWQGKVQADSRSRMNLTFTTGDDDRDAQFVKEADAAGLSGLKGHRSVGGLRASLYNAQTDEAVDALVSFMQDFEQRLG